MGTAKRPVVIFTAFGSLTDAYSLSHVVREQLLAFLHMGHPTQLVARDYFEEKSLPDTVREHPLFTMRKEIDMKAPYTGVKALMESPPDALVIGHDVIFVKSLEPLAEALHHHAKPPLMTVYHMVHSSARNPAREGKAAYRCSMPAGHKPLALSQTERPFLAHYYQHPMEDIRVLPNHLPPLLSEEGHGLAERSGLLDADYAAISAISLPRAQSKGINEQMQLIKALGPNARLLIANAHSQGEEGEKQLDLVRAMRKKLGVEDRVFLSSEIGAHPYNGVPNTVVRELMSVCNLYFMLSRAEACPLVVLEASMAGCLLVVNRDLVGVHEMVEAGDVLTASPKGGYDALAARIAVELDNPAQRNKRRILRERGRAAYRAALAELALT